MVPLKLTVSGAPGGKSVTLMHVDNLAVLGFEQ
jgi:hypothetical protein